MSHISKLSQDLLLTPSLFYLLPMFDFLKTECYCMYLNEPARLYTINIQFKAIFRFNLNPHTHLKRVNYRLKINILVCFSVCLLVFVLSLRKSRTFWNYVIIPRLTHMFTTQWRVKCSSGPVFLPGVFTFVLFFKTFGLFTC